MKLRHPKRAAEVVEIDDALVKNIDYLRKRGWQKVKDTDPVVEAKKQSGTMAKMPNPGYSLRPVEAPVEAPESDVDAFDDGDGVTEGLDGYEPLDVKQAEAKKRKYTRKN